jgi:hypothetical protein
VLVVGWSAVIGAALSVSPTESKRPPRPPEPWAQDYRHGGLEPWVQDYLWGSQGAAVQREEIETGTSVMQASSSVGEGWRIGSQP